MNTQTLIAPLRILIIGHGKLATHLNFWFQQQYPQLVSITNWNRQEHSTLQLQSFVKSSNYIFICISDSAIENFFDAFVKVNITNDQKVFHFSGAMTIKNIIGLHPLMTFSKELYPLNFYENILFVSDTKDVLQNYFPFMKNNFFTILPEQKKLYHSLCVTAGNLPQILWALSLHEFDQLNIPQDKVLLYIEQGLQNFKKLQTQALTGPLIREDQITIEKNKSALKSHAYELFEIYESFNKNIKFILKKLNLKSQSLNESTK